jgi:pimeloyl-ACP methyl ester carboxylesterase
VSAPAPLTSDEVDGLAVTRRCPPDRDPAAPTVVLVHGAMDRAASFGRTMRRMGHLDVVAYDRRGYGASLGAGVAEHLSDHAHDLAQVIDWSGCAAAVVVGHSLGGTIAAALAVEGSVPLAAMAAYESPFPLLDDSFDEVGGGAVPIARERGPADGAEHFYRLMVGEHTWSRLRPRDREARRAEGAALMAELVDLRQRELAIDPGDLELPLLVGMGGLSSVRMRSGARLLAARAPQSRIDEIANAGHGAHLTHPDEFARYCSDAVGLAALRRGAADNSLA